MERECHTTLFHRNIKIRKLAKPNEISGGIGALPNEKTYRAQAHALLADSALNAFFHLNRQTLSQNLNTLTKTPLN